LYSYLFLSFSLCMCVSHHAMHYSSVQSFKVTVAFMVQGR
jgi:hypothetical protein